MFFEQLTLWSELWMKTLDSVVGASTGVDFSHSLHNAVGFTIMIWYYLWQLDDQRDDQPVKFSSFACSIPISLDGD